MNNDERLYYIRLAKNTFQNLPVTQAFLITRKLVKIPATEEDEVVYYTESDNLTLENAMRLYKPESVALYNEQGGKPQHLGLLSDYEEIPDECNYVLFAFSSPKLTGSEIFAMNLQLHTYNQANPSIAFPPNHMIIPWGNDLNRYLEEGILPSE